MGAQLADHFQPKPREHARVQQFLLEVDRIRPLDPDLAPLLAESRMGQQATDIPGRALPARGRLPLHGGGHHRPQVLLDQRMVVAVEIQAADHRVERGPEDVLFHALLLRQVQQHVVALAPERGDPRRLGDDGQRVDGLAQQLHVVGDGRTAAARGSTGAQGVGRPKGSSHGR